MIDSEAYHQSLCRQEEKPKNRKCLRCLIMFRCTKGQRICASCKGKNSKRFPA